MTKHAGGRPTLYKPEYCEQIIEFFDIEPTKEVERTKYNDKTGDKFTWYEEVANSLPTFERFAVNIGVHRETLLNWCEEYPKFFDAYKKAKDIQKNMLIDLAMRGFYNPTFSIFTAKNITDMKDKTEVDNTIKGAGLSIEVKP